MKKMFAATALAGISILPPIASAQGEEPGPVRLRNYDLVGYIDDLRVNNLMSAFAVLGATVPLERPSNKLLLVFVGDGVVEVKRLADKATAAFPKAQKEALGRLSFDTSRCHLASLEAPEYDKAIILVADTLVIEDEDVAECVLRMFALAEGMPSENLEDRERGELISELFRRYGK